MWVIWGLLTLCVIVIVTVYIYTNPKKSVPSSSTDAFQYRLCHDTECTADDRDFLRIDKDTLTPDDCQQIIDYVKKKGMYKSQVRDFKEDNSSRISETQWISPEENMVVSKLYQSISQKTGIPYKQFEPLQVVRYTKGGFFKQHYDQCETYEDWCISDVKRLNGVRYMTFLIYLNDEFEGGETEFPNIAKKFKPPKGDAIVFYNTNRKVTCVLPDTLHSGLPILSGEKWIANVWIRFQPCMS